MGMANKVPGVSGGTVAFVLGFYEELIYSLQKLNFKAIKLLFSGRWLSFYRYINASFLLPVFLGSLCSYFFFSVILDYLLENFGIYVWATFFGMVIGSIIYIYRGFDYWTLKTRLFLILGVIVGFSINFMDIGSENDSLWFVFLCGIIGVSGMALPGLSGSFILMLLGNYVLLMVDSVNAFFYILMDVFTGDFSFMQSPDQVHYLKIIFVFGLGSVAGLVSLSQFLSYLLRKYNHLVTAVIIGFITGSLGAVWPWKNPVYMDNTDLVLYYEHYWPDWTASSTLFAISFVFVGILSVLVIDLIAQRLKQLKK